MLPTSIFPVELTPNLGTSSDNGYFHQIHWVCSHFCIMVWQDPHSPSDPATVTIWLGSVFVYGSFTASSTQASYLLPCRLPYRCSAEMNNS